MKISKRTAPPPVTASKATAPSAKPTPSAPQPPAAGWTAKTKSTLERIASDAAGVTKFVALKATEVVAPSTFEAEDNQAIAAMSDAITRHDEPAVAAILQKAGPRLATKLWQADLPRWVEPTQYLETLKTGPNEMWRVKWNYDFSAPGAAAELQTLAPPLKGPLGVLNNVKKVFPAGDQPDANQIHGATTSGYDPNVPGSGAVTPNVIRMSTSTNSRTAEQMPIALMTYSESPWFDKGSGVGFNDEFKALTPNIILAKGRVAEYTDPDLHGSAAGGRPLISQLLGKLAGGERVGVQPQAVRFWMQRSQIDANETPVPPR
jgi:hypothetical protein